MLEPAENASPVDALHLRGHGGLAHSEPIEGCARRAEPEIVERVGKAPRQEIRDDRVIAFVRVDGEVE